MNEYDQYRNTNDSGMNSNPEQENSASENAESGTLNQQNTTNSENDGNSGSYDQNMNTGYGQGYDYGQNRNAGYGQGYNYGQNQNAGYGQSYNYGQNQNAGYGRNYNYGQSQNTGYGQRTDYGYDLNGQYSFNPDSKNTKKTKKKHTGLVAGLVTLAALLLIGCGIFFMVRSIILKSGDNTVIGKAKTESGREIDDSTVAASKEEETVAEESKAVSLVKSGSVGTTSTSGEVILTDVSQIVENVMPCLVAITDNLELASSYSYNPYSYFFGYGSTGQTTQPTVSSASGVIIGQNDEELLIVTNHHVVNNDYSDSGYTVVSSDFSVTFVDGESAPLSVKGTDESMDLAVIAVKLSDLTESTKEAIRIAVIGNSDDLKVGEGVIAIGNAKGYGQSVTMGIISAKNREVTIDDITRTLLQTDAAINPGNSGGGLFNSRGELIGINESKYADTDIEGMCFAVPITAAEEVIERLMNMETISEEEQGYLGVQGAAVPDSYISAYGYPAGVSVTKITENSPAELAGLQIYDIITAVNGTSVTTMNELKSIVNSYKAGTEITLSVMRPDGRVFKEISVNVTLVTYEELAAGMTETETEAQNEQEGRYPSGNGSSGDSGSSYGDMDQILQWFYQQMYGSQKSQGQ